MLAFIKSLLKCKIFFNIKRLPRPGQPFYVLEDYQLIL